MALCTCIRFNQISELKEKVGVSDENTKEIISRYILTGLLR
jgi:hypothetical protein